MKRLRYLFGEFVIFTLWTVLGALLFAAFTLGRWPTP